MRREKITVIIDELVKLSKMELVTLSKIREFLSEAGKEFWGSDEYLAQYLEELGMPTTRQSVNRTIGKLADMGFYAVARRGRKRIITLNTPSNKELENEPEWLPSRVTCVTEPGNPELPSRVTGNIVKVSKVKVSKLNKKLNKKEKHLIKTPQAMSIMNYDIEMKGSSLTESLVIFWEENRPSERPYKTELRKRQLKAARRLYELYDFVEILNTSKACLVGLKKGYANEFEYCPRVENLEILARGNMYAKMRSFITAFAGKSLQESKMIEI